MHLYHSVTCSCVYIHSTYVILPAVEREIKHLQGDLLFYSFVISVTMDLQTIHSSFIHWFIHLFNG